MVQAELFKSEVRNGKQPQQQKVAAPGKPSQFPAQRTANPNQPPSHSPQGPYRGNGNRTVSATTGALSQSSHDGAVRMRGRIGRYFDFKQTQSGKLFAFFSMATVRPYRDESGNWQKKIAWQRVVVWGEAAQVIGEQLRQGAQVQVEGKFKTREWTDRENRLHTTTDLVARDVLFVDSAESSMAA
jgi:single-strand DNA-binding protein